METDYLKQIVRDTKYPLAGEILFDVEDLGGRACVMCERKDRPGSQAINQTTMSVQTIDGRQHVINKDGSYVRSKMRTNFVPTAVGNS